MNMDSNLFQGELVRLAALDSEEVAAAVSRNSRDSEFFRLMDSSPCRPYTKEGTKKWIEKQLEEQNVVPFAIRTLAEDRLIGDVGLGQVYWSHGDTYLGIGIGERDFWGKGYGTDAMKLALRYAFIELNLRRVTLNVYEYNPRAIRCYEKLGFQHEGRVRRYLNREGRRWDLIYMGIMKEEWLASNPGHQNL
jgi:RimJ/RimL family protein N-acetyltransferase